MIFQAPKTLRLKLKSYIASTGLTMSELMEAIITSCAGRTGYLNHSVCFEEPTNEPGAPTINFTLSSKVMELLTNEVNKVGIRRHIILHLMADYYLSQHFEHNETYDQVYRRGLLTETYSEYQARLEEARLNKKLQKEEARRASDNSKRWLVIKPGGKQVEVNNLREYCAANDLIYSQMLCVANGNQQMHRRHKV